MDAQAASPTRCKEGFWQHAKTDAVDRVWARLCAHSRGEGRVKSCSSPPAGSALPAAGGQTGRISRATEVSGTRPCATCGAQAEGAAGPQRDNAPHRGHGEGLRGSEARTGACRSEDERGWSAPHAQREASAISVCGSRSTITGAKTERPFPGEHFSTSCWRAGPDDQPRHRRSVPSGQGGTTNPSNVGIKRFRDGSAGPRFVLAQAPAENGLSCGTHGGPGEDASAEQNGRGEFSKPTKAPGHGRAQERYGEKRAREKRRRSVTLPSFFDEPARCGRTK